MIPLKINNKHLIEIFEPEIAATLLTDDAKVAKSIEMQMYPSRVNLAAETYSKDAERTADYELEDLVLVNRKSKPEFTWDVIKADYVKKLLAYLQYKDNYKVGDEITPVNAPTYSIEYWDFVGVKTITAYLGQTIEAELKEYMVDNEMTLYWEDFRIAFPEE